MKPATCGLSRRRSRGFFEIVDPQEVADALLRAAGEWLRERGCRIAIGPVSPSSHYVVGSLTSGFDAPSYLTRSKKCPFLDATF